MGMGGGYKGGSNKQGKKIPTPPKQDKINDIIKEKEENSDMTKGLGTPHPIKVNLQGVKVRHI